MIDILRLPRWHWPMYSEARYYGWRHGLVAGKWLVLFCKMPQRKEQG